jgi:hypothetical protein
MDVVERLKAYSGQRTRDECMLGATGTMIWDAIDEIERLRAERRTLRNLLVDGPDADAVLDARLVNGQDALQK